MVRHALALALLLGLAGCATEPPPGFFDDAPRKAVFGDFWFGTWADGAGNGNAFYMDLDQDDDGGVTGIIFSSARGFGTITGDADVGEFALVATYGDGSTEQYTGGSFASFGSYQGDVSGSFSMSPSFLALQGSNAPSGSITGQVVVAGLPLDGAIVRAGIDRHDQLVTATTGTDGQFTLPSVAGGSRVVSVTKPGYSTALRGVVVSGGASAGIINVSGAAAPPFPTIAITEPIDGESLPTDIDTQRATLLGAGTQAVISLNGNESLVPVNANGTLNYVLILARGVNVITTQITNATGTLEETILVNCNVAPRRLRVTLVWNTGSTVDDDSGDPNNDQDMHVWFHAPGAPPELFQHAWYGNQTAIDDGEIDVDNVWGFGPENYTMDVVADGTYRFAINYYSGSEVTELIVRAQLNGATPQEQTHVFGPYVITTPNGNTGFPVEENTLSWWRVVDLTASGGTVTLAPSPNPDLTFPLQDDP